jgi:hypothetical protein
MRLTQKNGSLVLSLVVQIRSIQRTIPVVKGTISIVRTVSITGSRRNSTGKPHATGSILEPTTRGVWSISLRARATMNLATGTIRSDILPRE